MQRMLHEFSTVMFISDYMSHFHAIGQIFSHCPVRYDLLCGQHVFTAEHNRSQPDYFACCQFYSAVFWHSKVRKGRVDYTSKGNFVVFYCRIIIMWWRTLFLVLWSQKPSKLCWTFFLDIFQPQAGDVDYLQPFKCEESSGQKYV